jgi:hypothetical protein
MRAKPLLLTAMTLMAFSPRLIAQSDWVAQCQRANRGNDHATHCEERESRAAARASVTIDAGQNGGVSVEGGDVRDLQIVAKVQSWAPTQAVAAEIAGLVRIETGGTLGATGPNG